MFFRIFAVNLENYIIMARPIKETPTLYGEDARRFAYAIEHPRAISQSEMQNAVSVYQRIQACCEF